MSAFVLNPNPNGRAPHPSMGGMPAMNTLGPRPRICPHRLVLQAQAVLHCLKHVLHVIGNIIAHAVIPTNEMQCALLGFD